MPRTGAANIDDGFLSTNCHNCNDCVRDLNDFGLGGSSVRATPANIKNNGGIDCDRWSCPYTGYLGPMGYEGHCEAIIAGSAVWNLAQAIGFPATRDIWYDSLIPSKSAFQVQSGGQCNTGATVNGCGANNWYTVFQDVDDGTYECEIWDAFDAQGIACGARPTCGPPPVCGDNNQEGSEVCDGTDLGGETCVSQGFASGTLACNGTCDGFDTSSCVAAVCGNNTIEGTEVCDGTDLGGETCVSQGFTGTLACDSGCGSFDTSSCDAPSCAPYHDEATGISGRRRSWKYYTQDLDACATSLTISISGGTGDADLYVRQNANPTTTQWECRPYLNGNNETCTFNPPVTSSTYHIGIRGYTNYSGVTLTVDYN